MNKEILIKKIITNIQRLPVTKVQEVNDFAEFLLNKIDNQIMTQGIQEISSLSKSFDFLNQEPDMYSINELKFKYQ